MRDHDFLGHSYGQIISYSSLVLGEINHPQLANFASNRAKLAERRNLLKLIGAALSTFKACTRSS